MPWRSSAGTRRPGRDAPARRSATVEPSRSWGADVREYRWSQPLLLADDPAGRPRLAPAGVRAAVSGEEGAVFPAAVAMFREEVGVDPLAGDGGRSYRTRIAELIRRRRTYVV